MSQWQGICPACKADIGELAWPGTRIGCPACSAEYPVTDGIYRLIPPSRLRQYQAFLDDYTRIRHAEGRGSKRADYYLRLPQADAGDAFAWQWRIRNTSFRCFCKRVLAPAGRALRIVDLGAGVGWLSYRTAGMGHRPVAIDLSIDPVDGLAAARHYQGAWPRVQAEFDNLPLADSQADLIVFNASLHYSCDYRTTLAEALRVMAADGRIVIMDTPVYRHAASGEQMKAERHDQFEREFGLRSDSLDSREYLTGDMLNGLARELGLEWRLVWPWYGWRRAWRPLAAQLRGAREPSRFALITGARIRQARS